FDLEVVAGTGRQVLELQGHVHRAASLRVRMAEVLGVGLGLAAKEVTVGQRIGYSPITGIDVVDSTRHLEDTPSLIDPDVTDKVGQLRAAVSGAESSTVRTGGAVNREGAA